MTTEAQAQVQVDEKDDGIRFQCSGCDAYVMPEGFRQGMKCDQCGEWFTLCERCMPDLSHYTDDVKWLCQDCR